MNHNKETIQAMVNEGRLIGSTMRNMLVHDARSSTNVFAVTSIAVFSILMKYCSDNKGILPVELPDILEFEVLQRLVPDVVPDLQIRDFLRDMQAALHLESDLGGLYDYLYRVGLRENAIVMRGMLDELEDHDLSVKESGSTAVYAAIALIETMKKLPQTGSQDIPQTVLRLMGEIADIPEQASCYSPTGDGVKTLLSITGEHKVSLYAPLNSEYEQALNIMLLMMAQHNTRAMLTRNRIEWLPLDLLPDMGRFDLVTAFPRFGVNYASGQIGETSDPYGSDFIEWWPVLIGSREWVYARHVIKALSPHGVGYVIYPLGTLSRLAVYEEMRRRFIDENLLDAVIELPAGTFDKTMVKAAILVFRKDRMRKDILMVHLGSKNASKYLETKRGVVVDIDEKEVGRIIRERAEVDGISCLVSPKVIIDNGVCFSPSAYILEKPDLVMYDIDVLLKEGEQLEEELKDLSRSYDNEVDEYMRFRSTWNSAEEV